ncbi:MAG: VOC family protein [Planctomycetota bacterium]
MNNDTQPFQMTADHVCIGVSSLDAAIRWYTDVLDFELDVQWTVPELPGFRLAYIRRGDWRIELIDSGARTPGPVEPMAFDAFLRTPGFSHLCFRVEDVDAVAGVLSDRGVTFEVPPTDFPDVQRRVAFFRDFDGNYLELAGPMVGEEVRA